MGAVYRAFDPSLERRVALKIVRPARIGSEAQGRLYREAQALAQVRHPNVVAVHDLGVLGKDVFVAMELLDESDPLSEWQRGRPWEEVVRAYLEAASGLAAAHDCGLVHRDVKPDNVLVGRDGRVTVIDFGLATAAADGVAAPDDKNGDDDSGTDGSALDTPSSLEDKLTRAGVLVGTPPYMSPEQHDSDSPVDARTDQYSLAVALYEVVCGVWPFGDETPFATSRELQVAKCKGDLSPPRRKVPRRLLAALERALCAAPEDRFPSMRAFARAAGRALEPPRKAVAVGLGVVLAAGVALALALALAPEAPRCDTAGQAIEELWSPAARRSIADSFSSSDASYGADTARRVSALLDERASDWVKARKRVCEATWLHGEQSEALLDRRMQCLDRRLNSLRSMIGLFSTSADSSLVSRSMTALSSLEPASSCVDSLEFDGTLADPGAPGARAQLEAAWRGIDELRVLTAAGRYAETVSLGPQVLEQVDALGVASARAEARYVLAVGLYRTDAGEAADETLARALTFAAEADAPGLEASILARRIWVLGRVLNRRDGALALVAPAEAALLRAGDPARARADFHNALGVVHFAAGSYEQAREHWTRRLAILERTSDRFDPALGWAHNNLAAVSLSEGRYDEAVASLEDARSVWEIALGPDHPAMAVLNTNLGIAYERTGRLEDAIAAQRRALSSLENAHGPIHSEVAITLNNLGYALLADKRPREADATLRRALATLEKLEQPDQNVMGRALSGIGEAQLELGNPDSAVAPLERAVEQLEAARSPYLPDARFGLARALWAAGGERERERAAREASAARDAWLARGDSADSQRHRVEDWLAETRATAAP